MVISLFDKKIYWRPNKVTSILLLFFASKILLHSVANKEVQITNVSIFILSWNLKIDRVMLQRVLWCHHNWTQIIMSKKGNAFLSICLLSSLIVLYCLLFITFELPRFIYPRSNNFLKYVTKSILILNKTLRLNILHVRSPDYYRTWFSLHKIIRWTLFGGPNKRVKRKNRRKCKPSPNVWGTCSHNSIATE